MQAQIEWAVKNMELALQIDRKEAIKRVSYLVDSEEAQEFEHWLNYQPAAQVQESSEVVRAKEAQEFLKSMKPKPEEPGFEP